MMLGKYDQASKVIKQNLGHKTLKENKYSIDSIALLQAETLKEQGKYQLALEVYQSIRKHDEIALILVKQKKTQEILELMRQMGKD